MSTSPTSDQLKAWDAGGYVVERISRSSANGVCLASSKVYRTRSEALAAAARIDRPEAMTFINYACFAKSAEQVSA